MITVGIRNLRNSLSKYINSVKSGETILVTDHNKIVAEIKPASVSNQEYGVLDSYINEQSDKKSILKSTRKTRLKKRKKKRKYDQALLKKIYNDARQER